MNDERDWLQRAESYAREHYGVNTTDLGYQNGDWLNYDPEDWVYEQAQRYDLLRLSEGRGW